MENQPDPMIFAVVPYTEAEKQRYLPAVMDHLWSFCDQVNFWPDPDGKMLQNESMWRQLMLDFNQDCYWESARDRVDWILVNDADEFVVSPYIDLHKILKVANAAGVDSLIFGLDELWQLDPLKIRTDKYWAGQKMMRMFRFDKTQGNQLPGKQLACGSIPSWARVNTYDVRSGVRVLHAGYADASERQWKFDRYNGRPEHGSAHVQSIMDEDVTLEDVPYETPAIWRGTRN